MLMLGVPAALWVVALVLVVPAALEAPLPLLLEAVGAGAAEAGVESLLPLPLVTPAGAVLPLQTSGKAEATLLSAQKAFQYVHWVCVGMAAREGLVDGRS